MPLVFRADKIYTKVVYFTTLLERLSVLHIAFENLNKLRRSNIKSMLLFMSFQTKPVLLLFSAVEYKRETVKMMIATVKLFKAHKTILKPYV